MREKGIEKKKSGRSPPFEGLRGVSEELKKKQRKEFEKEDVLEHLFSFFSFFFASIPILAQHRERRQEESRVLLLSLVELLSHPYRQQYLAPVRYSASVIVVEASA